MPSRKSKHLSRGVKRIRSPSTESEDAHSSRLSRLEGDDSPSEMVTSPAAESHQSVDNSGSNENPDDVESPPEPPGTDNVQNAFDQAWNAFIESEFPTTLDRWRVVSSTSTDPIAACISTFMLGWCTFLGLGIEADIPEGYRLMLKSQRPDFVLWFFALDDIQLAESMSPPVVEFFRRCSAGADRSWVCKHLVAAFKLHGLGTQVDHSGAVERFKELSSDDHAVSTYVLGICYNTGTGVEKNLTKMISLIIESANQGYSYAQVMLGDCYYKGDEVTQSFELAVKWYRKSADAGLRTAQYKLGICYAKGNGVKKDSVKALKLYQDSADQGLHWGQYAIASRYYYGKDVDEDNIEAVAWFSRAAAQGNKQATLCLKMIKERGLLDFANDGIEKNEHWPAAKRGDPQAQFEIGSCYHRGQDITQDYTKAVEWFRKSANEGNAQAQFNLGLCYENGHGVKRVFRTAFKWYTKAVEQGYPEAQNKLGYCYRYGLGVKRDPRMAYEFFTKSAQQGYALAQVNLGNCFAEGEGVSPSHTKAIQWYRKAASQGDADGEYKVGCCYHGGRGVVHDVKTARSWYERAATRGHRDAISSLENLDSAEALEKVSCAVKLTTNTGDIQ
ncbi:uncharacterized protein BJ171DRAFT_11478 [Polychytrium aggregatum]|uniref:uncharacterized protein n=1 Tax=Polychytrium aggregatum TaxID=110093 RepID=UPI0022FECC18|nr:uncharacterized protein BJ171DRAFT_11478 [Polychytrium aggregatum]KAI9206548.1 hypothetical protein BJ171DRAFT_11478 [Polychytrium aggregatum]